MEIFKALGVELRLVLIQIVGFLILLYLLKRFLFAKIQGVLKGRAEEIKSAYEKIEANTKETERLKLELESRLANADKEADRKIQEAVKQAKVAGEDIIKRSEEAVEKLKEKAHKEIEMEKKKVLAEIKETVIDLSMLAASKIIEEGITKQHAEKLVDEVIENMETLH